MDLIEATEHAWIVSPRRHEQLTSQCKSTPAGHADCPPHAAANTGRGPNATPPGSGTRKPRRAGRRSTPAASCAERPPPPLALGSRSFAAGAVCGRGHARRRGASICRRSARSSRTAPPALRLASCWPGSQPAPSVSSSLGCEDGSACPHPAPNVPQYRSCHEKRRPPRSYVIIRDGAATCVKHGPPSPKAAPHRVSTTSCVGSSKSRQAESPTGFTHRLQIISDPRHFSAL